MRKVAIVMGLVGLMSMTSDGPQATDGFFWSDDFVRSHNDSPERSFQRVGTLANYLNNDASGAAETVSEIISATADGKTLVYTDAVRGTIGFIDITDPGHPQPLGILDLDPANDDDSPTSVDVLGNTYALVAVNTSASFTDTSGQLVVVDVPTRSIVTSIALGGQPDSIKISPDGRYAAIVIENERNEDLCVGGTLGGSEADEEDCVAGGGALGVLPQTVYGTPPGFLAVLKLIGNPLTWSAPDVVALTGLSAYAPDDPEPEFVDVNARNEAVVTLQENNHLVIVDLPSLTIKEHFAMGSATIKGIDAQEDGVISLTDTLVNIAREPDAVAWVPGQFGALNVATANEGDLFGGTRGFSIFQRDGKLLFDSGNALEEIAVQHGHYPEDRSDAKGTEPEAIAYAKYGRDDYLFVGTERGSFVAVYKLDQLGRPVFEQLLPGPMGPEGLLTIPGRNLLVVSGETDLEGLNARSTVMIYELKRGHPAYPQIISERGKGGGPIPWSAISGLVSIPGHDDSLLGVWDSAYAESNIFRIDVSDRPAAITDVMTITGGTGNYDPEGIAIAPDRTLWVASEGNATDTRQNLLIQTDFHGRVIKEIGLPDEVIACRQATTGAVARGTLGSGFEGVAVLPSRFSGGYKLVVAQQRGWNYNVTPAGFPPGRCEELDDDGGGLNASNEPNWTRLWIYDPRNDTWDWISWELAPKSPTATWIGLSEITEIPASDEFILIERDNRGGDFAVLKTLVKISWDAAADRLVSGSEKLTFDLLPRLRSTNGWITDKPEGVAVNESGQTYVVTDNDGVEDWNGESWFFDLGKYWRLFD